MNEKVRINKEITAEQIYLVGTNVEAGIYDTKYAISLAEEQELDLVEVGKNKDLLVCKILDYEKYLYEKRKNEKKPSKTIIKEIKLRPATDEADYNRKVEQAKEFLSKKFLVKVIVVFAGREKAHPELGELMIYKFIDALSEVGTIDSKPSGGGKQIMVTIKPKK